MRTQLTRLVATVLIVALQAGGAARAADLSQQMAGMFGSGALANVTGPGAYRSQTQNIYTGGELQLRFPTRSYQLWSLTMPSVNAGCGGVDAYLGSFSHISTGQFKDMLEATARSYGALLFKVALKSINPLIESVIGDIQKTAEAFSVGNANTCAMAQSLLDMTSTATGMTAENTCVTAAMRIFDEDLSAAKRRCRVDQTDTNRQAKASADPAVRELADRDMNLVWEALSNSTLNADEKTVFLNIAGTIVIYKPSNNANAPKSPVEHAPSIDSLNALLHGDSAGNTPDEVKISSWLSCPDAECLSPVRGAVSITPFPTHVRRMLEGIRDKVIARQALTAEQRRFVDMTRVPVYRMLAAGYTSDSGARRDDLVDQMIHRYAKVIAYDYAWAWLRNALKELRVYLGMARLRNRVEEGQSQRVIANVDRLLAEVDREHQKALAQVRDANAVVDDLQRIERDLRATLPGSVRGMLDLGNLLRGAAGRS